MDNSQNSDHSFWRYLIRPGQRATAQLDDLCIGLARIISDLEPGPDAELTPLRLSAFYRSVGGNYDSLFLGSSEPALSFMYRTLGCFHSLQPTSNPFHTPNVPCLTPAGFSRWQTIHLLLNPEEHATYLQKAVQIYEIPRPDGGYFPKNIPRDCFPDKPDEAMDSWHRLVTGTLNQEHYVRRIKNSPYQSPHPEPVDRRDSYFIKTGNGGRPGQPPRSGSQDEQQARLAAYRRRSSVPDIVSPLIAGTEKGSHWDPATRQQRQARSHSAQRPAIAHRQRSNTTNATPQNRKSTSPSARRYGSLEQPTSRPSSQRHRHHRQRPSGSQPKSPSPVDEDTGSEASSEASQNGRRSRHRTSEEDRQSRKNSLWPPSFLKSHKRRHSSDASYRNSATTAPALPQRPEHHQSKHRNPHQAPSLQPPHKQPANVRFNNPFHHDSITSPTENAPDPRTPTIRYPDAPNAWSGQQMDGVPTVGQPLQRESSSGSGTGTDGKRHPSDWSRDAAARKSGVPMRVHTVTGVGGRKYANSDPRNPIDRSRPQVRGSLPTPA